MERVPWGDRASIHSPTQAPTQGCTPWDVGTELQRGRSLKGFQAAPPEFNVK